MSEPLIFEKDGPVVTLTINRPESRNPLGAPED
ncbi:MAG: enoyl-CoA hydratase, partial [Parvibaculum sp.]